MEGRAVAPSFHRSALVLGAVVALGATAACQRAADVLPGLPAESPSAATTPAATMSSERGDGAGLVRGDPLPRGSVPVTMVSGIRDDATGEVRLNPVLVLAATRRPAAVPGAVTARLVAEDGATLGEATGELAAMSEGEMSRFMFFLDTPRVPAARLEVAIDGTVVATAQGSGSVPAVAITQPATGTAQPGAPVALAWEPTAPDGADLVYAVYASTDGRSWRAVVGETTDLSATVPADLVAEESTGAARILVAVSDGVNGSVTVVRPFG